MQNVVNISQVMSKLFSIGLLVEFWKITAKTRRESGRKSNAIAIQWEGLSLQSTSVQSDWRACNSCGGRAGCGVILRWQLAKCSGVDGFKFRAPRPQNDKVRGRGEVRKPLFLEIPIIWLFKSTGACSPPLTPCLPSMHWEVCTPSSH